MRRPSDFAIFRLTMLVACGGCGVPRQGGDEDEPLGESDEVKYEDVLAACGAEADALPGAMGVGPVSSRCATQVGGALRIDWPSFAADPHEFTAATSADELVVAGALFAILSDAPEVGERLQAGSDDLRRHLGVSSTSFDGPGDLWLSWFQDRVTGVFYVGDDPYFDMSYSRGTVSVGDIADTVPPSDDAIWMAGMNAVPVAGVASELTHEASHAEYPAHVACADASLPDASCDPDQNGAYGAGALWGNAWFETYGSAVVGDACLDTFWFLSDICRHINDRGGFAACDVGTDTCEEAEEAEEAPDSG